MDDSRLKKTSLGYFELVDKPTLKELNEYYANKYYQQGMGQYEISYDEDELKYIILKIKQRTFIVDKFLKRAKGKLLDVGCGEGFTLKHYFEKKWQVKGVDFSRAGLEQQNPDMLDYVDVGDIYEILNGYIEHNKQYDVICMNGILEHVIDPVKLLKDIKKLIARRGIAVITVPNDCSNLQEHCFENKMIPHRFWITLPDHLSYFSYESLNNIVDYTGWSFVDAIADFPIDLYLLHPESNYIYDDSRGPAAHRARIQTELLLSDRNIDDVVSHYRAMAKVGLGRALTAFIMNKSPKNNHTDKK